ncbi:MAG: two-component system chemotaxis sensor kinase CheA [Phenylobacterium sp.]|jgi:two-component system chemotaxis sensor kinase CheA
MPGQSAQDTSAPASLKEFIVDHLNIGVFSIDKDMNVLLWNGFMVNNSHRSAQQVLGKNLFELFPELPQKWLQRKVRSVFILKNFAFSSWEQRPYLFKFSHNRPITGGVDCMRQDLMLMPVKGDSGEVEAVSVAILDMTDVSIFQNMMAQTMNEMETLDSIVKTINRETDLENLLTTVLQQGFMLFPQAQTAIFLLRDKQDDKFSVAAETSSAPFAQANEAYLAQCGQTNSELSLSYDELMARYTKDSEQLENGLYILREPEPCGAKPYETKPYETKPYETKPCGAKPYETKPYETKPYETKPYETKPYGSAPFDQTEHIKKQKCSLSMAITIEDKPIGFLVFNNFDDEEVFANSDLQKLSRFREHVVSAISKARFLKAIAEEGEKTKNLLDNAGQGFLSFSDNLQIEDEYSAECCSLFGGRIEGLSFPELILPQDCVQQGFLRSILQDIFASKGSSSLFLSLLPQETTIGGKTISIEYRPISGSEPPEHKMMVILTDITETRALENQMEEERNRLRMVVSAVTRRNEIVKAVKEYQAFCLYGMNHILAGNESIDGKVFEIFRMVHTFKGGFSQLDLVHVVKEIHQFESQLSQLRSREAPLALDEFKKLCTEAPMWQWMEPDLAVLEAALGAGFLGQEEMLTVGMAAVDAIGHQMLTTLSPIENHVFQPMLRNLKARPFKDLLIDYGDYIERLAEELDKAVSPLDISGDDISVNPDEFIDFSKSLVHVFRNILDHGIETIEDRMELGKDEVGLVTCKIRYIDNEICLEISDDGSGIDVESLRQKAIDIGLYELSAANDLSDKQLIELIFAEQISSKDSVNELSGRGIGLSAVKLEVVKLGGRVSVTSELGVGTTFYFRLPFTEAVKLPDVDVQVVVSAVVNQALLFLADEVSIEVHHDSPPGLQYCDHFPLNDLTVFMRIKGLLEGVFLFSFEDSLARAMVRKMMLGEVTDESEFVAEAMAESCNIILGNSMNNFPGISELVIMEVPLSLNTKVSTLDNLSTQVWTSLINTVDGSLSVSFLSSC